MSITTARVNDHTIQINVGERFDYACHKLFRNAYIDELDPGTVYQVNLSNANHMDSSALGMLLLLKEHAERKGGSVILLHPSETVRKILKIANFDKLMKIE